MNVRKQILKKLRKKQEVTSADIIRKTGFSRTYVNRFFQELVNEGIITPVGKTHHARYILANDERIKEVKETILKFRKKISNSIYNKPDEFKVLESVKKETGIFINLEKNVEDILDYAFTEMLNNAIEHSKSEEILIEIKRIDGKIYFDVTDYGVGIFKNIMEKFALHNELEAIQDLLKGKQTTAPKEHTGEGIFFTSKAADNLIIQSSDKRLIFNNIINDFYVKNHKQTSGTKIKFLINESSRRNLTEIFLSYTDEEYEFTKTDASVKLFKEGTSLISRSQAKRITNGLDKFKTITLDFKGIETVGQGFADEIFRVWKNSHPDIEILSINDNEIIRFMIERAKAAR